MEIYMGFFYKVLVDLISSVARAPPPPLFQLVVFLCVRFDENQLMTVFFGRKGWIRRAIE